MIKLPEKFLDNMKTLLSEEEMKDFVASYDEGRFYGIRANTLRISPEELKDAMKGIVKLTENVPWCKEGFYYEDGQPGRNPLYHAGVYYIQEPSAMYPGGNVPLKEGAKVLDICAAPGGKTTQLAGRMAGSGILVSNDINEERCKALVKNVQMAGIKNAIVTNETPEKLAENFESYFDVIVVDAPCSGEGMFRKDEEAVKQWESFKSERCRAMQDEILEYVDKMLKPGGILSYSTCTFSIGENEDTLRAFMKKHEGYEFLETPKVGGVANGIILDNDKNYEKTARLWPHKVNGEGHFTAFLKKGGETPTEEEPVKESKKKKGKGQKKEKFQSFRQFNETPMEIEDFFESYMRVSAPIGSYYLMGTNVYYLPVLPPNIDGLKVAMAGVYCGELQHGTFKMSHQFAMTCKPEDFSYEVCLDNGSDLVDRYLKGETLMISGDSIHIKAFGEEYSQETVFEENLNAPCCVSVKAGNRSYLIGLGTIMGATIKNLYPKGWRRFT